MSGPVAITLENCLSVRTLNALVATAAAIELREQSENANQLMHRQRAGKELAPLLLRDQIMIFHLTPYLLNLTIQLSEVFVRDHGEQVVTDRI